MGKKKKGKGKKKKGKKKKSTGEEGEEYVIPFDIEPLNKVVTIKPLLLHWSFSKSLWPERGLDIDVKKTVGTLKRIIARRHGSVESIQLWRSVKAPQNLLDDDRSTLEECGFVGRGKEIIKSPLAHLVKGPPTKVPGSDDDEDEGAPKEEEDDEEKGGEEMEGNNDNNEDDDDDDDNDEEEEDPNTYRVIYDFVPKAVKDPLLLLSPRVH